NTPNPNFRGIPVWGPSGAGALGRHRRGPSAPVRFRRGWGRGRGLTRGGGEASGGGGGAVTPRGDQPQPARGFHHVQLRVVVAALCGNEAQRSGRERQPTAQIGAEGPCHLT